MTALRRAGLLAFLALVFAFGQYAAAMHDLSHGMQRIHASPQDSQPAPDFCEKCLSFAQLSGAASSQPHVVAVVDATVVAALAASTPAQSRTVVHSRSRAPPLSA